MTTIVVRDIVTRRSILIENATNSINIDTTGIASNYQLLITLFARTEMFLRINGDIFSEIGAGIYLIAIRNGEIVVYFLVNLPSNSGELDPTSDRCRLCCDIRPFLFEADSGVPIISCVICTSGGNVTCK